MKKNVIYVDFVSKNRTKRKLFFKYSLKGLLLRLIGRLKIEGNNRNTSPTREKKDVL